MSDQESANNDVEMLKKHCEQLSEHFDTVHIFTSRHMPAEIDGTRVVNYGSGHWYARYGQISAWCIENNEGLRDAMRLREE